MEARKNTSATSFLSKKEESIITAGLKTYYQAICSNQSV